MDKIEIARNWIESLEYDKFVPLNKAQGELLNSIKGEFNDEFIILVTAIGCTKKDNENNEKNYHEGTPYRHQLDKIIMREDPRLGKIRMERTKQIKKEALKYGQIL